MAQTELTAVQLDGEIEKELTVKERLEEGLKADKAALEEHRKKQKAAAYKALAGNNARAAKRLDESESQLAKLTQRISSHEQAIETAAENIAKLRERKSAAAHQEALKRYNEQTAVLLNKATKFEAALTDFLRGKTELETQLEILDKCS